MFLFKDLKLIFMDYNAVNPFEEELEEIWPRLLEIFPRLMVSILFLSLLLMLLPSFDPSSMLNDTIANYSSPSKG